jgi:hypothetical protein
LLPFQRNSPCGEIEIGEQSLSTGMADLGGRGLLPPGARPTKPHRRSRASACPLCGWGRQWRLRWPRGRRLWWPRTEGIEIHCNSKSQVHMTPPVNRTGSVGTSKRAPASSAITPAAAHPATRSSSRAHTPAIMAGLKRLAPSNYVVPAEIARIPSIRSLCCARAANGQATAVPPRSVTNSRRLIQPPGLRTSLGQEETTTCAPGRSRSKAVYRFRFCLGRYHGRRRRGSICAYRQT